MRNTVPIRVGSNSDLVGVDTENTRVHANQFRQVIDETRLAKNAVNAYVGPQATISGRPELASMLYTDQWMARMKASFDEHTEKLMDELLEESAPKVKWSKV